MLSRLSAEGKDLCNSRRLQGNGGVMAANGRTSRVGYTSMMITRCLFSDSLAKVVWNRF